METFDITLPLIRNIATDTRLVPIGNSVTNTNIKYIESANKKEILIIYLRMLHMQQIHVTKQVLHSKRHVIVLVIVPTPTYSVVTGF